MPLAKTPWFLGMLCLLFPALAGAQTVQKPDSKSYLTNSNFRANGLHLDQFYTDPNNNVLYFPDTIRLDNTGNTDYITLGDETAVFGGMSNANGPVQHKSLSIVGLPYGPYNLGCVECIFSARGSYGGGDAQAALSGIDYRLGSYAINNGDMVTAMTYRGFVNEHVRFTARVSYFDQQNAYLASPMTTAQMAQLHQGMYITTNNLNTRPLVWYDYTNDIPASASSSRIDNTGVRINAHTTASGGAGSMNAQQIFMYSNGSNGWNGFDIGETNTVYKTGTNWSWNAVFQHSRTGHTPVTYDGTTALSQDYNLEIDMSGSGPDLSASAYDPVSSAKAMILLSSWPDSATSWTSNTQINKGDARTYQINGVWQLFLATVGGTTGSSTPSWVVDHTKTFTDGSVTWQYQSTVLNQIGTAIRLSSQNNTFDQYGTFLSTDAVFYDAVLDFSKAGFATSTHAVMRMPSDSYIDLSGDGTSGGQNKHIFGYSSSDGAFELKVNGSTIFGLTDSGIFTAESHFGYQNSFTDPDPGYGRDAKFGHYGIAVVGGTKTDTLTLSGQSKSTILGLTSPKEGMVLLDTTDHQLVVYLNGSWYPISIGSALSN